MCLKLIVLSKYNNYWFFLKVNKWIRNQFTKSHCCSRKLFNFKRQRFVVFWLFELITCLAERYVSKTLVTIWYKFPMTVSQKMEEEMCWQRCGVAWGGVLRGRRPDALCSVSRHTRPATSRLPALVSLCDSVICGKHRPTL